MTLSNGLAVVTGAGSGIGRSIAVTLAGEGAAVAVVDLNPDTAKETEELITGAGGRAKSFHGDTSKAEDLDRAIDEAIAEFGPLEIMVNNAGINDEANVDALDEATWRRVIDVDLTGVFLGCKRAIKEMLPREKGRIINIASVAGLNGTGGGAAYIAAKHGVIGLTRQMAVTYSAHGITTNAVCPGPVRNQPEPALPPDPRNGLCRRRIWPHR